MTFDELIKIPHGVGKNGIHISAQLRVEAMHLEGHRIAWAGRTMEQAANRIDALENELMKQEQTDAADRYKAEPQAADGQIVDPFLPVDPE